MLKSRVITRAEKAEWDRLARRRERLAQAVVASAAELQQFVDSLKATGVVGGSVVGAEDDEDGFVLVWDAEEDGEDAEK